MTDNYDVSKMKTCVLNIQCVCEQCKRKIKLLLQKVDGVYTVRIDSQGGRVKVTGNFDPKNLTRKLEKSGKCSEKMKDGTSSSSFMSAPHSEWSQGENSKAGESYRSKNSLKSGEEGRSHKGSKALTSASMENKSVKTLDLTDLESKRSGQSKGSGSGGGKAGGNGGLFGFGKFFGSGNSGGKEPHPSSKKSPSDAAGNSSVAWSSRDGSKKSSKWSNHSREKASQMDEISLIQDREHSVAGNSSVSRSSRGESKKSSKKSPLTHHSEDKASRADDLSLFQDVEHSVGRSSRGGSRKGSKRSPMSHHSGEIRSQMGDPHNHQEWHNQQGAAYYGELHRSMPPPPQRESYEHYLSDENANACNIM